MNTTSVYRTPTGQVFHLLRYDGGDRRDVPYLDRKGSAYCSVTLWVNDPAWIVAHPWTPRRDVPTSLPLCLRCFRAWTAARAREMRMVLLVRGGA